MSKITAIQIRTLEVTANAVAFINKGIDKAQSAVVNALNSRLDWLAYEYLGLAAAATAAPYKQAELVRAPIDALTAEFIEEGERRKAAYTAACAKLISESAECTSPEALAKAQSKADAIRKARIELLARKK